MIEVLTKQQEEHMDEQARQYREQMAVLGEHIIAQDLEMKKLIEDVVGLLGKISNFSHS